MTKLEDLPVGTVYIRFYDNKEDKWVKGVNNTGRHIKGRWINNPIDSVKKVIGRLPPDQLDAKEWKECYRLPQAYLDDPEFFDVRWEGTKWVFAPRTMYEEYPRHKPSRTPLSPGMVVAFRSWPNDSRGWGVIKIAPVELGEKLVVVKNEDCKVHGNGYPVRQLSDTANLVRCCDKPYLSSSRLVRETDDIEVLGRVPMDQLYTATEFEPLGLTVEEQIRRGEKLPVGTLFRFRSFPERWTPPFPLKEDIFEVLDKETKDGGRKFKQVKIPSSGGWDSNDGVLPTDDIEIIELPTQPTITYDLPPLKDLIKESEFLAERRAEEILRYQDELAEVKKERDEAKQEIKTQTGRLRAALRDRDGLFEASGASINPDGSYFVPYRELKRSSLMKKTIILVAAGALFSHLPLNDMYVTSVDYFKGSREVVHGDYQKTKVCGECETIMEHENAVICPKCGTENIETRVAAPLYRDRGWPLSDIVVGTQFRNEDGSTKLVLEDK